MCLLFPLINKEGNFTVIAITVIASNSTVMVRGAKDNSGTDLLYSTIAR